jgi:hypothetical protein
MAQSYPQFDWHPQATAVSQDRACALSWRYAWDRYIDQRADR